MTLPLGAEPERVRHAEGIVGLKVARLVKNDSGIWFAPRFPRRSSLPYGAVADAVCESAETHDAPDVECRCGFHAVPSLQDLWRLEQSRESVVLAVELTGQVLEHEFGWRGAHQEVLGARLPARCTRRRCRRTVAGVAPYAQLALEYGINGCSPLRPVCARCGRRRFISLADLASQLCVEVSVSEALDELPGVTLMP